MCGLVNSFDAVGGSSVQVAHLSKCMHSLSMHPPHNTGDLEPAADGSAALTYAFAVFDLDQQYLKCSGTVALSKHVTPEKFEAEGSPVTFSILADGQTVWSSKPIIPGVTDAFEVDTLAVKRLELRVQAAGAAGFAHAIWCEPSLEACSMWYCDGWRNPADAFTCSMSGSKRGATPDRLEAAAKPTVPGSRLELAASLLCMLEHCAVEHARMAQFPDDSADLGTVRLPLDMPYGIQVDLDVMSATLSLLDNAAAQLGEGDRAGSPELEATVEACLSILAANIQILQASAVSISEVRARPGRTALRPSPLAD